MFEILDQSELRAFLYKICNNIFLVQENFPFCFRTTKYAIGRFWNKNDEIAFWLKFLTSRNQRHLQTKFFGIFFFERILPSFLGPLNMLSACFGAKMLKLYFGQNFLLVGQNGIFLETLPFFFFSFYRIFHGFLRSLNTLPICFQAKMAKLHSGRNS